MYKIRTTFSFEAAHHLTLNYDSPCSRLHGHSYKCSVTLRSPELDDNGMIVDFKQLKQLIKIVIEDKLDHRNLDEIFLKNNATAEYMAKWICERINEALVMKDINAVCCKVELNETEKNQAIWEED